MTTTHRIAAFADSAVTIEAFGARAERLVEFVFRHVSSSGGPVHDRLEVREDGEGDGGTLTLSSGTELLLTTRDDGQLVEHLMQAATFRLLEPSRSGAQIHGALVDTERGGVLMPGTSGSGKSTLAAWLVTRGFALATDELVHFPLGSLEASGFPRPIHLKRRVASITNASSSADRASRLPCGEGDLLHAAALGGRLAHGPLRVSAIVFPSWSAAADDTIVPLAPASATRALMELLPNARNLPEHGLPEAARLARSVPAFRLKHRSVEVAEELLRSVGAIGSDLHR